MKRILCFAFFLCVMLSAAIPAVAADTDTPAVTSVPTESGAAVYPVNIIISEDKTEIRKVYDCEIGNTLCEIPRDTFELNGYAYHFFDMTKEDMSVTDRKEMTETVTLKSKSNDTDTVMSLLPQTKDMTYDDGFAGTLALDVGSVKTEVSGYGSSNKTVTTTRTYPNLSDADMQYIPKTTEHNGKTLDFESVEWQTDNTMNVDDYEIPNRYTAIVTYSGTTSSSYVKGYTITANYKGEVKKTYTDKARYTAIFIGEPIVTAPAPTETPTTETPSITEPELPGTPFNWLIVIIPLALAGLVGGGALAQKYLKDRKEKTGHEEKAIIDDGDDGIDDRHDDYPGIGG